MDKDLSPLLVLYKLFYYSIQPMLLSGQILATT